MEIPAKKPFRLWPGIVAAVLLCLAKFVVPVVAPDAVFIGMIGCIVGALAIIVWWLFFSRASWFERVGIIILMIVALVATSRIVHVSIRTGMMGMMLPTMMLTGFMFPLENMPWIFRAISHVVPSRYYYEIMKAVMLKGLGIGHVWRETAILFGMATALLMISLKAFKTRLA